MTSTLQIANGDWVLDKRVGRPVLITRRPKLEQDVLENLSIATQANGFGAGLDDVVGLDIDPAGFKIQVQQNIRNSITAIQQLQDRFQSAQRTPQELIASIAKLSVAAVNIGGGNDKTGFSFQLRIRPVAGDPLAIAGTV
jgi:hypothetical protein